MYTIKIVIKYKNLENTEWTCVTTAQTEIEIANKCKEYISAISNGYFLKLDADYYKNKILLKIKCILQDIDNSDDKSYRYLLKEIDESTDISLAVSIKGENFNT